MSKVPAKFIGLSTTIGIQQPIGTYGGQIYLQKWCQPMVFPDVLYWPINYYHRYLKTYRHLCYLQKWCQPMVEIVFPDGVHRNPEPYLGNTINDHDGHHINRELDIITNISDTPTPAPRSPSHCTSASVGEQLPTPLTVVTELEPIIINHHIIRHHHIIHIHINQL